MINQKNENIKNRLILQNILGELTLDRIYIQTHH